MALLPLFAAAQERLRPGFSDELWLSAQVRSTLPKFLKKPLGDHYKRLRMSGELGYRSADNFFAGRQIYTDLALRYRFNKHFNANIEYRYADRGAYLPNRQRLLLVGRAGTKVDRFDLGYRFIQQWVFLDRGRTRNIIRNRFSVGYDIRKWKLDPEFSMEFFTRTDQPQGWNHIGTRYSLGTSFSPWKGHTFSPSIIHDRDARVAWPMNRIMYSIDYVVDLRRL